MKQSLYDRLNKIEDFETTDEIQFCNKLHECGHNCDGIKGETECLPCMSTACCAPNMAEQLKREMPEWEESPCAIC